MRLRRMGNNKNPFFRVVAADVRRKNDGVYLEALGWYDPKKAGVNFEIKADRIEYWKSKGAILSDTVVSLVRRYEKSAKRAPAPAAA
ncbi:MAG: 30S ribosomal protein S16 [bacterium]